MGNLRPGGYATEEHERGGDQPVPEAAGSDRQRRTAEPHVLVPVAPAPIPPNAFEAMLHAVDTVRTEMAGRDAELHQALVRIAQLYERVAENQTERSGRGREAIAARSASPAPDGAAVDEEALRTLLRSIDTLATVTEASITRASDLSRSVQHLVEAVQGLTHRVDNLVWRSDVADARLEVVGQTVDGLSEQVAMVGRHLGSPAAKPRPALRAVGREDAPPSSLP